MTFELHGRVRFSPWGILLSESDEESPAPIRDACVEIAFVPQSDHDHSELFISSTFVAPTEDLAATLVQWWPDLLEEARQYAAETQGHASNRECFRSTDIGPAEGALFGMPEPPVRAFFDDARRTLHGQHRRVAGLLRWHLNLHTFGPPHERKVLEWSQDGREWVGDMEAPDLPQEVGHVGAVLEGGQELLALALRENPEGQPLAHELLQEALALAPESPRSALVLAITAAEVGLKSLVGDVGRADAAWLLSRPQSPPLDDLLQNYLPFVTHKRTRQRYVVPRELRKLLRRGVESRNKVVHYGEPGPSEDDLFDLLTAVSDLLYIFDWFAGREWALENVSPGWAQEYSSESP